MNQKIETPDQKILMQLCPKQEIFWNSINYEKLIINNMSIVIVAIPCPLLLPLCVQYS